MSQFYRSQTAAIAASIFFICPIAMSVCRHSYHRNFGTIPMKLYIVVWGAKTKIKFVGG